MEKTLIPHEEEEEEEEDEVVPTDQFDRLHDSLLLEILSLVSDVKSLGRCSASSRRLRSLVPLVSSVLVPIDCVISDELTSSSPKPTLLSLFSHFLNKIRVRVFNNPQNPNPNPNPNPTNISHHSPSEVLSTFVDLRDLRIVLPSAELRVENGVFLKWKASFGSSLDRCVILGASPNPNPDHDDPSNGSLKIRVVWTISSLIAASARHYLLKQIVNEHEGLERLNLSDADGQGELVMDKEQLRELRAGPVSASGTSQRTLVPALSMKMWYASRLEIPGGAVMEGATLVAIRPAEEDGEKERREDGGGGCWVSDAFEEPYRTAARMLVKRRTYCLEMNSF